MKAVITGTILLGITALFGTFFGSFATKAEVSNIRTDIAVIKAIVIRIEKKLE